MTDSFQYLLIPLMSAFLVTAQALWGSFIKNTKPFHGSIEQTALRFLASPKIWLGAILYISALIVYFLLLSKLNFFVVQIVMTGLAILLSVLLAILLFHERINAINLLGIILILTGILLVFNK